MKKSEYPTFEEKKKKEGECASRQNTKWKEEIARKCVHEWKPIQFIPVGQFQPDINSAKVYCVCMKCCSFTYIVTAWIGYYLGSPDILEETNLSKNLTELNKEYGG